MYFRRILIFWVWLLAGAAGAGAQATVELNLSSREHFVNEPFILEISVREFAEADAPVFPELRNCEVNALGASESVESTLIRGRQSTRRTKTFRYEITAQQPGPLVIPGIQIQVDGRTLKTRPRTLQVQQSDAGDLLFVEITAPRERVYVGERVRLTMTIWLKPVTAFGRQIGARDLLGQFQGVNFGPFSTQVEISERTRRAADGSKQSFYTYESTADFVPQRPGRLNFDEVFVSMNYPLELSRDVFGSLRAVRERRLRARPTVAPVEILPLPEAGRPANFTGAVGQYEIRTSVNQAVVRVGDPIELTIELSGTGELETLPPPPLERDPALTELFRLPADAPAGEVVGQRKRFVQVVRAKRADVTSVPPIEYAYFDPQQAEYVIARSAPIELSVTAADSLVAADLGMAAPVDSGDPAGPQRLDGLLGNETDPRRLLRVSRAIGAWDVILAVGTPAALYSCAAGWLALRRARHDETARRRQTALRSAGQRLEAAQRLGPAAAAAVANAMANYLADRLHEPPARLAGRDGVERLRAATHSPELAQRWADLLERCERTSFGGAQDDERTALIAAARTLLGELERVRLG